MAAKKTFDPLVRRFGAALDRHGWFRPGDRVAVAVSGGADSVALFRLLAAEGPARGLQLAVAHFDHGWRSDSTQDAEFVAGLAAAHGAAFRCGRAEGSAPAADREQQARRVRYDFFASLVQEGWANSVATAHTADDQAETVMLRVLRGTGPAGLAGILPRRGDGMVRPLLGFRRGELRAWLEANQQPWREDPTNLDVRHRRNLLRRRFLPELAEAFNPALVERLSTLAEVTRGEEEFWTAYIGPLWQQLWRPTAAGGSFLRQQLASQPLAVQRRLLRTTVRHLQGDVRHLDAAAMDQLIGWIAAPARHPRLGRLAHLHYRLSARELAFASLGNSV